MTRKINEIESFDRPREKMLRKGQESLSNLELLAVLLGSGIKDRDVFKVAREITGIVKDDLDNLSLGRLINIEGIGPAKACQLMAAIEFSKRFLLKERIKIGDHRDVVKLAPDLRDKKQEYFLTLTLDGGHRLIRKRTVFIGTLNQSLVHPREIFADAITDRAAGIIFVHNHPSGNPEPSPQDITLTQRLMEASKILGIEVLDHVIIAGTKHFSFQSHGLLIK